MPSLSVIMEELTLGVHGSQVSQRIDLCFIDTVFEHVEVQLKVFSCCHAQWTLAAFTPLS